MHSSEGWGLADSVHCYFTLLVTRTQAERFTRSIFKGETRSRDAYSGGGFIGRSYISSGGSSTRA